MTDSKYDAGNLIRQIAGELKRDKKKCTLLIVALVGACVIIVDLSVREGSPASAGAAVSTPGAAPSSSNSQDQYDSDLSFMPRPDEIAKTAARDEYIRKMGHVINRDLFAPNPDFFPPVQDNSSVKGTGSRVTAEDVEDQHKVQKQIVLAQAKSLAIQSTMISSSNPTAIINGRILSPGDWISGFQVISIATRICKLTKHDVIVTLEMSNQGKKR